MEGLGARHKANDLILIYTLSPEPCTVYRLILGAGDPIGTIRQQSTFVNYHSSFLKVFLKKVLFLADLVGGFGILGGNRTFFKTFENNIF